GDYVGQLTGGPDGRIWFTDSTENIIGQITSTGINEFKVPTPGAKPFGITTASDGALWFTESAKNKIGRLALDGTFNEYTLPAGQSNPTGITSGAPSCVPGTMYVIDSAGLVKVTF
ncbi:MAG: virginiamycin B lyase, partial [Candidatus Eremiobacteraeota bacterium]|nr:virginiamycin B lyase [Candidatus Eremiobacteraeota bacterium]